MNNDDDDEETIEYPADLITQSTAARIRGVSSQAISNLIRAGRIKKYTIDTINLVRRSEIEAFDPLPKGRKREEAAPWFIFNKLLTSCKDEL